MDILEMISVGETQTVEFKSWIKSTNYKEKVEVLVKEAVGFANAKGGFILVGVEDNGEVTGCENVDPQNIIESIYDKTIPKLFTEIQSITIGQKKF